MISIQDLERIMSNFNNATNEQDRQNFENVINEWRCSPDAPKMCILIVRESSNPTFVIFATQTLINIIKFNSELFSQDDYSNVYMFCFQRIRSQDNKIDEGVFQNLICLAAQCTVCKPYLFSRYTELTPDELIYYFDELIIEEKRKSSSLMNAEGIYEPSELKAYLNESLGIFFDVLGKARLCAKTFYFMKTVSGFVDPAIFSQLFPLFQKGIEIPECIPGILDFLEEILTIVPENFSENDFAFLKPFILLMINFAEQVKDLADQRMDIASVIWSLIIDTNFEFFGNPMVGPEFTHFVFSRLINALTAFIQHDIYEFYNVLEMYAQCLNFMPYGCENMMIPYIENFFDYVAALVDQDLSFCCPDMKNCLMILQNSDNKKITSDDDDDDDECSGDDNDDDIEYDGQDDDHRTTNMETILSQYYNKKINDSQLSQGVVYIFAYAPLHIWKMLATNIGVRLSMMTPSIPLTVVYFLRNCCKYAADSIEPLIAACFNALTVINPHDVGQAFVSLVKDYGDIFLREVDNFLPPFLELAKNPNSHIAAPFFTTIFLIFSRFTTNNPSIQQLLMDTGTLFLSHVNPHFNSFDDLKIIIKFLLSIIKRVSPNNEMMKAFLSSLFSQIMTVINPFLWMQNESIQELMCQLIKITLKSGWIADSQSVMDWISEIMSNYPQKCHFDVLLQLNYMLPTERFLSFLSNTQHLPEEIIYAEAVFIKKLYNYREDLILQFPLDLLLFFMQFTDSIRPITILLMKMVKKNQIPPTETEKLLSTTLSGFFFKCVGSSNKLMLEFLILLSMTYFPPQAVLGRILEIAGPSSEEMIHQFSEVFLSPAKYVNFIDNSATMILSVFRKNHPQ